MKRSEFLLVSSCLLAALGGLPGCRAIGRFGDSRQSIAARRLSGQGFQAMHDGQWEIAEKLFSDALDVSKADDRAHWGLAESYWKRGDTELAVAHMEQAVRLSAGDPKFVQRLGRMYLELGRLEDADSHSLWALESTRDSAEAWALRGDCLKAASDRRKRWQPITALCVAARLRGSPTASSQYLSRGRSFRPTAGNTRLSTG